MRNLFKEFFQYLLKLLAFFILVNKNKVTFVRRSVFGSNSTPVSEELRKKYKDIKIMVIDDLGAEGQSIFMWIRRKIYLFFNLLTSKIVVTTHGPLLKTFKNITIDLWHAFPTKKAGLMLDDEGEKNINDNLDYFLSYSEFSSLLLNSRYGMKFSKFIILGSPRNDYLFEKTKNNPYFINNAKKSKIVFFMPTFRDYQSVYKRENLLFKTFDLDSFNDFLKKKNIIFIMSFHPNDKDLWLKALESINYSNVKILDMKSINNNYLDFYQVLPYSDLLITDYSSSYIDYLLLDKPMIFTPTDIDQYNKDRGLILEPYDFWRPGPKCVTQDELQKEILLCLDNPQRYSDERKNLRSIFHKYYDGKSTERVADFIYNKLKGR